MSELDRLAEFATAAESRRTPWCLATVFRVDGSSYRRPGARMIVAADGMRAGAISGGCLESEVAEQAAECFQTGRPSLVLINDGQDESEDEFGTGCGGLLHVLIEPQDSARMVLDALQQLNEARTPGVIATGLSIESDHPVVRRAVYSSNEAVAFSPIDLPLHSLLRTRAAEVLGRRRTELAQMHAEGEDWQVLFELVSPGIRMLIVGDGHDVPPVVRFASAAGHETVLVGRRPVEELREMVPGATDYRFVMHPERLSEYVETDEWTAAVLMSHNYQRDKAALNVLLDSPCFYLGILGPLRRTRRMVAELDRPSALLDPRVHAPLGLDIGAETPDEIALSLVGEIQAAIADRPGARLRDRVGPIHPPVPIVSLAPAGGKPDAVSL